MSSANGTRQNMQQSFGNHRSWRERVQTTVPRNPRANSTTIKAPNSPEPFIPTPSPAGTWAHLVKINADKEVVVSDRVLEKRREIIRKEAEHRAKVEAEKKAAEERWAELIGKPLKQPKEAKTKVDHGQRRRNEALTIALKKSHGCSTAALPILHRLAQKYLIYGISETIDHDGYDEMGPESNIYHMIVLIRDGVKYFIASYHYEQWFQEGEKLEYEEWEKPVECDEHGIRLKKYTSSTTNGEHTV